MSEKNKRGEKKLDRGRRADVAALPNQTKPNRIENEADDVQCRCECVSCAVHAICLCLRL